MKFHDYILDTFNAFIQYKTTIVLDLYYLDENSTYKGMFRYNYVSIT